VMRGHQEGMEGFLFYLSVGETFQRSSGPPPAGLPSHPPSQSPLTTLAITDTASRRLDCSFRFERYMSERGRCRRPGKGGRTGNA
jgi:hypothetical protein